MSPWGRLFLERTGFSRDGLFEQLAAGEDCRPFEKFVPGLWVYLHALMRMSELEGA